MKTLTRTDLVETLSDRTGLSRSEASEVLEDMLDMVGDVLDTDGDLKLSRFGLFSVRKKNARTGRNPKTKKLAAICARRVVTFKPSNMLRHKIETSHQHRL